MVKKGLCVVFFLGSFFFGVSQKNTDSAKLYFAKADSFYSNRNFRLAQQNFDNALRIQPKYEAARLLYARMLADRNQYGPSKKQLDTVLAINPNSIKALQALYTHAYQHHLWTDMLKYGTALQQKNPSDSLDEGMAKAMYQLEDYPGAIALMEKSAIKKPTAPKYIMLAKCYAEVSDYKQAAAAFKKAIDMDASNANTWYEYGLLQSALPDYAGAISALEKASALGYKKDMAYTENLANLYLQTNDFEKGIVLINELVLKKPKDDALMFLAGQAYYKAKKFVESANYYEKAFATNPENFRALYMQGMSLQKGGKTKKGEALCNEAIAGDPSLSKYKTQTPF